MPSDTDYRSWRVYAIDRLFLDSVYFYQLVRRIP
jgi:hypothetical protein